jgi:DNA-binding transcriptional ArsR family regulator
VDWKISKIFPQDVFEILMFRFSPFYFETSGNMVDNSFFLFYATAMKLDYDSAASLLSQLGNITRLKIVRELVRAGDAGKPVGEIRNILDIPNSTLSHHLSHLRNVGLIRQEREKTVLRCFVNYDRIDGIVSFLTEECCVADPTYNE